MNKEIKCYVSNCKKQLNIAKKRYGTKNYYEK